MPGHLTASLTTAVAPDDTDAALVARTLAGDAGAARALVQRHLRPALAAARAILDDLADAEDACQDAFAKVFAQLERYEPAHPFRAWLLTIVRNRAIGLLRQRRVRQAAVLGAAPGEVDAPAPARDDPAAIADRAELRARLAAALATLPAVPREVLLLHDVEGWTHDAIAAHVGVRPGTSRSILFKARRRLRAALGPDYAEQARRAA